LKRYTVLGVIVLVALSACASAPVIQKPQYTQRHYRYSVLLYPERPINSPMLDIALSLLQMEYPAEKAEYLNRFLYTFPGLNLYKDQVINDQREFYRAKRSETALAGSGALSEYWRYAETVDIKRAQGRGIIIERYLETYTGGAHPFKTRKFYVIDMDEQKQLKVDDFLAGFQEKEEFREIVYGELRKYSRLEAAQQLSEGIFFSNQPELTFNFFLTNEGLGLHWDPSQIAPYSEGEIEVVLPWDTIHPMMLPASGVILSKFNIKLSA